MSQDLCEDRAGSVRALTSDTSAAGLQSDVSEQITHNHTDFCLMYNYSSTSCLQRFLWLIDWDSVRIDQRT